MSVPGPALTEAETELLDKIVAAVWTHQLARRAAKLSLSRATGDGFEGVGVTRKQVAAARAAGARARLDTYLGPWGSGWALTVRVERGGETWEMTRQRGPERWRERGWERVTPLGSA